jgi:hypothetical protein
MLVEEAEERGQKMEEQVDLEDQVEEEMVVDQVELLMEQLIQVVEEVVEDQMVVLEVQEDQVLLLLEVQVLLISLQRLEQTQLQHYRHQLEVVKLRHSRFLEHLQLANNSST